MLKVRAVTSHTNVVEVDKTNADAMIATGRWELVPEVTETPEPEKEEVAKDDGSKPARRRRAPRSSTASG